MGQDFDLITDEQLQGWLHDTAGWGGINISREAFEGCGASASQLRPLVQAALEEGVQLGATKLRFSQVPISLPLAKSCGVGLSAYAPLRKLVLRELSVLDDAIAALSVSLANAEHLISLTLDQVVMSDAAWGTLAGGLKVNSSIRTLKCKNCLTPPALSACCRGLQSTPGVASLDLSQNPLGDPGVIELCEALSQSSGLTSLRLVDVGCGPTGALALGETAKKLTTLRAWDLSRNPLMSLGIRNFACGASSLCSLSSLRLSSTGADDACCVALAPLLAGVSGQSSRSTLAHTFKSSLSLPWLKATQARIRGQLPSSVAGAAGESTGLELLELGGNRIGPAGLAKLVEAARKGGRLRTLTLSGNGMLGDEGASLLTSLVSSLTSLDISDCEITNDGASSLATALSGRGAATQLPTLTALSIASNQLTAKGIGMFAEVLKANSRLTQLDLSYNWVGAHGMSAITELTATGTACWVKRELLHEYRLVDQVKHNILSSSADGTIHLAPTEEGFTSACVQLVQKGTELEHSLPIQHSGVNGSRGLGVRHDKQEVGTVTGSGSPRDLDEQSGLQLASACDNSSNLPMQCSETYGSRTFGVQGDEGVGTVTDSGRPQDSGEQSGLQLASTCDNSSNLPMQCSQTYGSRACGIRGDEQEVGTVIGSGSPQDSGVQSGLQLASPCDNSSSLPPQHSETYGSRACGIRGNDWEVGMVAGTMQCTPQDLRSHAALQLGWGSPTCEHTGWGVQGGNETASTCTSTAIALKPDLAVEQRLGGQSRSWVIEGEGRQDGDEKASIRDSTANALKPDLTAEQQLEGRSHSCMSNGGGGHDGDCVGAAARGAAAIHDSFVPVELPPGWQPTQREKSNQGVKKSESNVCPVASTAAAQDPQVSAGAAQLQLENEDIEMLAKQVGDERGAVSNSGSLGLRPGWRVEKCRGSGSPVSSSGDEGCDSSRGGHASEGGSETTAHQGSKALRMIRHVHHADKLLAWKVEKYMKTREVTLCHTSG